MHEQSSFREGAFQAIRCSDGDRVSHAVQMHLAMTETSEKPGTLFFDGLEELNAISAHSIAELANLRRASHKRCRIAATTTPEGLATIRDNIFEPLLHSFPLSLQIPPLRLRQQDLVRMADDTLNRIRVRYGRVAILDETAANAVAGYSWPGNAVELEYRIESTLLKTDDRILTAASFDLPSADSRRNGNAGLPIRAARDAVEREVIVKALASTHGNISHAARLVGVSRPTLHALLQKFGLDAATFR